MFNVVRDARRVTVPPFGEDLEGVGGPPILELAQGGHNAGFFLHFTPCRFDQGLPILLAASDRLPVTGVPGAFQ